MLRQWVSFMAPKKQNKQKPYCLLTWSAPSWVEPSLYIRVTTTATACLSISISWLFSKSSKYLVSQTWFLNALESPEFREPSTLSASSNASCLVVFSGELLHVICFLLRFVLSLFSLSIYFFRKYFLSRSVFCRTEASWLWGGIRQLAGAGELMFCFWLVGSWSVSLLVEGRGESLTEAPDVWLVKELRPYRKTESISMSIRTHEI